MIKPVNKVIQGVFTIFHLVLGLVFFSLDILLFITGTQENTSQNIHQPSSFHNNYRFKLKVSLSRLI